MNCPHCNTDLRGAEIPNRPGEHYGRELGVNIPGIYDGVLYWQCPDCGGRWHRFAADQPYYARLRQRAEPYVNGDKP